MHNLTNNLQHLMQNKGITPIDLAKLLNLRSQKRSFNFVGFMEYLQMNPLPQPKIKVNLYKFS